MDYMDYYGPNGAGKSTLINIITDNLLPTKGEILWNGENIVRLGETYRKNLGYMPQQQGVYEEFSGRRFLCYIAALKEIPSKEIKEKIEEVAKIVNLSRELDQKIGTYSGGMKQRIIMASAILGDPKLLIFDEPTAGLDPKERMRVRNLIVEFSKNKIVIIATHIVSDIENIANEVILLKKGKLMEKASIQELIHSYTNNGNLEEVYMNILEGEEEE